MTAQFCHAGGYADYGEYSIIAPIHRLLIWRLPFAVSGFVIPIILDSAKAFSFWLFSHIFEKIRERHPSITNGDPTSTIMFPILTVGIRASFNHGCPAMVGRRKMISTAMPMLEGKRGIHLLSVTSTRFRVSAGQRIVPNNDNLSTITNANRLSSALSFGFPSRWSFSNNFQPSKFHSYEGYSFTHSIGRFNVVSSSERRLQPVARCDSIGKENLWQQ